MKRIILILAMAIFMSSFALAENVDSVQQTLGTLPQGQDIVLYNQCSNCTFLNITGIILQNGTNILTAPIPMTKAGTTYTYLLGGGNTTNLGRYVVLGLADEDGINRVWNYDFFVTPDGQTAGFSLSIFLILSLAAVILLGIAFLSRNEYVGFIAGAMFIVTGVYAYTAGIAGFSTDYVQMIATVLVGIGFMFEIAVGYQLYSSGGEDDE